MEDKKQTLHLLFQELIEEYRTAITILKTYTPKRNYSSSQEK